MESLRITVMYSCLAATGALVAFVTFASFKAAREEARSRAPAPSAVVARIRDQRRVT